MDAMVRKYKQRMSTSNQPLPSPTSPVQQKETSGSDTLPPALKRKHRGNGGEGVHNVKRSRTTDSDELKDNNLPGHKTVAISD